MVATETFCFDDDANDGLLLGCHVGVGVSLKNVDTVGTDVIPTFTIDGFGDSVNPKLSSTTDVESAGPMLSSNGTVGVSVVPFGVAFEVGTAVPVPVVEILGLGSVDIVND